MNVLIPEIKHVYRMCIDYAIRKQVFPELSVHESMNEEETRSRMQAIDDRMGYSIAGFAISHQIYKAHDDSLSILSKIDGITVRSILPHEINDDNDELVACLMMHDAYERIPGTFSLINNDLWYVIPSMDLKDTEKPLIKINTPLRFIEVLSLDGQGFSIDRIRQFVERMERDSTFHSPFGRWKGALAMH